jgi:uncharacterized protein (DUF885 family)
MTESHSRIDQSHSRIDQLSSAYVRRYAELHPFAAISMGLPDPPDGLTDYGPEAQESRADIARDLLNAVAKETPSNDRDRVAVESIQDRLGVELNQHDAGEWMRELRIFGSPAQSIQQTFELVPHATVSDWQSVVERMAHVPRAIASYRSALEEGVRRNVVAARRQALACGAQAATTGDGYFRDYVSESPEGRLGERLADAARDADASYHELAAYLRGDYLSAASDVDGVGRERYELACRRWTGLDLDLDETYAWGWDELARIRSEISAVADQILPGGGIDGAVELLETDPDRSILGIDDFIAWLQQLMDTALEELATAHFDIPDPLKRIEARVAPPGTAAAMYYTRPTEDFSRPGRTWYPDLGRGRFPLWVEVSTAYHEGVPGHHLQLGYTAWLGDRLNAFQRHRGSVSGHTEGWALYAERLMGEFGYLDNPDYMLGMLAAQAHRAARVIVDIGLHLGMDLPDDQDYHPGEQWTPELAVPFMVDAGRRTEAFMASEVDRYLGWPAQAISYKVGERVWLAVRETVQRREGSSFDLRRFHQRAFELGLVGLGQLERELAG